MAGFNPFAPTMAGKQKGDPQLQGVQAPNVPMQESPSLMKSVAPTVFNKAMGSETAGKMGTAMADSAKGMWAGLTAPGVTATQAAGMADIAAATGSGLSPMAAQAVLGSGASAAPIVAQAAGTTGLAAGTGAGALASAAPAAAALGPFGIPILIGAGLYAANQGK